MSTIARPTVFFRKYRFIFVDDRGSPYHLAIAKRLEGTSRQHRHGQSSLDARRRSRVSARSRPGFQLRHYQALRAIQQRIGLEYFGIDCGAGHRCRQSRWCSRSMPRCWCMTTTQNFPYKDPVVRRIKRHSTRCWQDGKVRRLKRRFARSRDRLPASISAPTTSTPNSCRATSSPPVPSSRTARGR